MGKSQKVPKEKGGGGMKTVFCTITCDDNGYWELPRCYTVVPEDAADGTTQTVVLEQDTNYFVSLLLGTLKTENTSLIRKLESCEKELGDWVEWSAKLKAFQGRLYDVKEECKPKKAKKQKVLKIKISE